MTMTLQFIENVQDLDKNYEIIDTGTKGSSKIAAFDLDHTLIKTKSGRVFPKDINDWIPFPRSKDKIKELANNGFKIVVFTNQSGSKFNKKDFTEKIENIAKKFDVRIQAFVSTDYGFYRKPSVGMYYLLEQNNDDRPIKESFYVGDAAGRPKEGSRKKDFSDSDLKFALNLEIDFYVPEEFFVDKSKKFVYDKPDSIVDIVLDESVKIPKVKSQEMIIMVGPPASSKSTVSSKKRFKDYVVVNQDILKTRTKVDRAIQKALKDKKSVIVDRKNEYIKNRKEFIEMAKVYDVPVRVFWFNIPKKLSEHLNMYRTIMTGKRIPTIVFNKYFSETKGFQEPTLEEGLSDIIQIPFVINEKKIVNKQIFYSYLV
jgi:bifunctional polynucleotide phosphatase/kinase